MILPPMPAIERITVNDLLDQVWDIVRRYPAISGGKGSYQLTSLDFVAQAHARWRAEHAEEWANDRDPLTLNCVGWAHRFIADWTRHSTLRHLPIMFCEGRQWLRADGQRHAFPMVYCCKEPYRDSEKVLAYCDPGEAATLHFSVKNFAGMSDVAVISQHGIGGQFHLI